MTGPPDSTPATTPLDQVIFPPTGAQGRGPVPEWAASPRQGAAPEWVATPGQGAAPEWGGSVEPPWITLTSPDSRRSAVLDRPISLPRVIIQVVAVAAVVVAIVALVGSYASRQLAEREAVNDAARLTDAIAEGLVQPNLSEGLVAGDPAAAKALHAVLDPYQAPDRLLSTSNNNRVVRIKLWNERGQVVFSDDPGIEGRSFELDDEALEVLQRPATKAEVTDLSKAENASENFPEGTKLLEVYRPVWSPSGEPLLLELYYKYDTVTKRSSAIWRGFAGVTLSSLGALLVLMLPLLWALLDRAKRAQEQREDYMRRALDASQEERRRIAAALHDGVVQELTAVSFLVAGSAEDAAATGRTAQATRLRDAAATVRASMGSLRSLLVEIYPPNLRAAGLAAALSDLATTVAGRDVDVRLEVEDEAEEALGPDGEEAVYRVAQECLRNVARHARAHEVVVRVTRHGRMVRLLVADDGDGFPDPSLLERPPDGHFGLRLMRDVASKAGGTLQVRTGPGMGTRWLFEIPAAR